MRAYQIEKRNKNRKKREGKRDNIKEGRETRTEQNQ